MERIAIVIAFGEPFISIFLKNLEFMTRYPLMSGGQTTTMKISNPASQDSSGNLSSWVSKVELEIWEECCNFVAFGMTGLQAAFLYQEQEGGSLPIPRGLMLTIHNTTGLSFGGVAMGAGRWIEIELHLVEVCSSV